MKRGSVLVLALAAGATAAGASITQQAQNELTAIDTLPTSSQLDSAFGGSGTALPNLAAIAQDSTVDAGIRLRAIHALTFFCPVRDDGSGQLVPDCQPGDSAYDALVAEITSLAGVRSGSDVLILRAAIASFGKVGAHVEPDAYMLLLPFLSHGSRDIRSTTARALADLGDCDAVTALRTRYQDEPFDQVRLAISAALRSLQSCP